jgi:NADH:ubiquinone oxidoreductase subunit 6 (subunit J)
MDFRQATAFYVNFCKVFGSILAAIFIGPAALLILLAGFALALSACFVGLAALLGLLGEITPASVMAFMMLVGNFLQQHREEIITIGPGLYFLFVVFCVILVVIPASSTGSTNQQSELNRRLANRKTSEACHSGLPPKRQQ